MKWSSKFPFFAVLLAVPLLAVPLACNRGIFAPANLPAFSAAPTPLPTLTFIPTRTPVITPTPVVTSTGPAACAFQAVTQWGGPGGGDGQFSNPSDLDGDSQGNLYVLDTGNRRVQQFSGTGIFLSQWNGNGTLVSPLNLVVDRGLSRLYVLDPSGSAPATSEMVRAFSTAGVIQTVWAVPIGSYGLAVDAQGDLYVGEQRWVAQYSPYGTFLKYFYSQGSSTASFADIQALAVDPNGNLFVAAGNTLQKLDSGGQLTAQWGGPGSGLGQFTGILYMRTDSQGDLYVVDTLMNGGVSTGGRVQKFDNNGNFLCYYPDGGGWLQGLAFGSNGHLMMVDATQDRILDFLP